MCLCVCLCQIICVAFIILLLFHRCRCFIFQALAWQSHKPNCRPGTVGEIHSLEREKMYIYIYIIVFDFSLISWNHYKTVIVNYFLLYLFAKLFCTYVYSSQASIEAPPPNTLFPELELLIDEEPAPVAPRSEAVGLLPCCVLACMCPLQSSFDTGAA